MSLSAGARLGPYEIVAPLGKGGMGEVWRARDTRLGREVALKFLPADFAADPERHARFEREAKLLASLNHPHIAMLFGLEHLDGQHALAMELVEGEGLDERIARGPIPVDEVIPIALQIAEALEAAHEKGIVHRDLKPANVKVRPDGTVKVLDFGLAKAWEEGGEDSDPAHSPTVTGVYTRAGVILGTAAYMSPEQARGKPVDKRADVWAFGCVLYEMLTGRKAFAGDNLTDLSAAIITREPDWRLLPATVPPPARTVLRRCLEKDARDRLRDIGDARLELAEVGRTGDARAALPEAAPASSGGSRGAVRWLAFALSALVAGSGVGWWLRGSTPRNRQRSPAVTFQRLTEEPGVESHPSLSPDGKSVAFVASSAGNEDIFLLRVGGRNPTNLTADSPAADYAPAFSPDGESIAFRSERAGGGIFVMGATGESVRRVTDFGFDPAWSSDGKQLVVDTEPVRDPTTRAAPSQLWVVPAAGGERRLVAKGDAVGPRWSPHGQRIAFWGLRWPGSQRDLFSVAADGSQADHPVAVTDDPALDWSPEWSPDGRQLYFVSNRGGTMNLWRVPIDEASGRALGDPESLTVPSGWIGGLSFSRDGRKLAMADQAEGSDVWRTGFDPGRGERVGHPERVFHGQGILSVDCTPDGESVVFSRRGVPWEGLVTVRADGSGFTQLTDYTQQHRFARWSPDGQHLAFASTASGEQQLWTMRADGSGLEQLTSGEGGAFQPAWSPDGRRIAYGNGANELVLMDSDRPKAPPVRVPNSAHPGQTQPVSWSPDGTLLAVDLQRPDRSTGILLFSLKDGVFRELESEGRWPQWLPDGRRLLYQSKGGLVLRDLAAGSRKWILPDGSLRAGSSWQNFCLSRDGRRLIYLESFGEGDIWLMTLNEPASATR
ncbi:MAG: serine/threonine-protein kinase [Acidobacteriia bacterium]|nr:serine/threonine-protein kinase [Terriglobia bacterium]